VTVVISAIRFLNEFCFKGDTSPGFRPNLEFPW
jgi:hypothetical protein